MALVDIAHAFEEEAGLLNLFQPPLPVSPLYEARNNADVLALSYSPSFG
jgi:hypothetical protein